MNSDIRTKLYHVLYHVYIFANVKYKNYSKPY